MESTLMRLSRPSGTTARPFDTFAARIAVALEERNWDVPGITVEFYTSRSGSEERTYVYSIEGEDFSIDFTLNGAANSVSRIAIPKQRLEVYSDNSGPTYYVYVGSDWESDKETFFNGFMIHSKLDGKPRTYLKYKGECRCDGSRYKHTHPGQEAPLLVNDNDLGRDYDAEGEEPTEYRTRDVFIEFTSWLASELLPRILKTPVAVERRNVFRDDPAPYPGSVGPLYRFGDWRDVQRARSMELAYGFGEYANVKWRLDEATRDYVPQYSRYDVVGYYGIGEVVSDALPIGTDRYTIGNVPTFNDRERYLFRITPNRANGIFVEDEAAFLNKREELFESIAPRDRLTDRELNQAYEAQRQTRIAISDYDGSFTHPIVLVTRRLDSSEVEAVSGPWPIYGLVIALERAGDPVVSAFSRLVDAVVAKYADYRDQTLADTVKREVETVTALVEGNQEVEATVFGLMRSGYQSVHGEYKLSRAIERAAEAVEEHRHLFG